MTLPNRFLLYSIVGWIIVVMLFVFFYQMERMSIEFNSRTVDIYSWYGLFILIICLILTTLIGIIRIKKKILLKLALITSMFLLLYFKGMMLGWMLIMADRNQSNKTYQLLYENLENPKIKIYRIVNWTGIASTNMRIDTVYTEKINFLLRKNRAFKSSDLSGQWKENDLNN